VVAVPMIRPEASRVVDCTVPPADFWRSMVWTILPEESRTTSRQVWAVSMEAKANENSAGRSAFMGIETLFAAGSFNSTAGQPLDSQSTLKKTQKFIKDCPRIYPTLPAMLTK
jgi:hypothetical protein